jgi:long-chain acyl-CoA synthetase
MPKPSLAALFLDRVAKSRDKSAFQFPNAADNGWDQLTWNETATRVRHIAMGLRSLGLESEDRVSLLCSTRVEWILADLGILCAGGATTTVYPSSTADDCVYIMRDSGSVLAFAENVEQLAKLQQRRDALTGVAKVILLEGSSDDPWTMTLAALEDAGKKASVADFDAVVAAIKPEHLATLIYTSGTTGVPKGVELTHDCWVFEAEAIEDLGAIEETDHQYLWLPLSHSFGKVLEVAQLQIGFRTTIDGRIPKMVENLGQVQPTFMAAAPRIFEKVYNKVVTGAKAGGAVKYGIFRWAVAVGREVSALRQRDQAPAGLLAFKFRLADKLVFSKLKARFGGRIRFFISGSAPLSRDMAEFFHAADILIIEGYGLTESSAASVVNRLDRYKFGTVGRPLKGVEVKIADADGEILLGGRGIMRGYWNKPEDTQKALTTDRWLRTGDIGELDAQGMLRITDRKKDLIKTSGGKYVAPQHLEGRLKALCPYVSQIIVHGNARNFCSALMTIDEEAAATWKAEVGLNGISYAELSLHPQLVAMVQSAVDKLNAEVASFESIKKFALLPKDLTVEDGELTPSMKVKRKFVEDKYQGVLEGFYRGSVDTI